MSDTNELDVVRGKDDGWKRCLVAAEISEQEDTLYECAHDWYKARTPGRRRDLAKQAGVAIYYLCDHMTPAEAVRNALVAWPDLPGDAILATLADKLPRWKAHPNYVRVQAISDALAKVIWKALTETPAAPPAITPMSSTSVPAASSSPAAVPVVLMPTLEVTGKVVERRGHRYRIVLVNGEPQELPMGQLQALADELSSRNRKPDKHALSSVRAWLHERGLPRDLAAIRFSGLEEPSRSVETVKTDK